MEFEADKDICYIEISFPKNIDYKRIEDSKVDINLSDAHRKIFDKYLQLLIPNGITVETNWEIHKLLKGEKVDVHIDENSDLLHVGTILLFPRNKKLKGGDLILYPDGVNSAQNAIFRINEYAMPINLIAFKFINYEITQVMNEELVYLKGRLLSK